MEHISPKKTYVGIWIVLMCLTMLTAGMSRIDLGPFNTVVALLIATCKGLLVVLFFMHAKYISERTTWVVIVAGFFWLLILLLLSMTDYMTRPWR
jgi:cytochrome c oxidase subunit 4